MMEGLVREATQGLTDPRYAPAVELALSYARDFDRGSETDTRGKLLATLSELKLTPKALETTKGVGDHDGSPDPLDELKAKRRTRLHHTTAVDSATP